MVSGIGFEVLARDGAARRGRLDTAHGAIETPVFMPLGTAASVKAMTPEDVAATGARLILGNTYHLMLRPGADRIARLGGLHRFMNWPHAILTDSGGFQVMSLASLRKITEEGVAFRSHLDGSAHLLSPERSIEIQRLLGADITMAFDECTPFPAEREAVEASMELSMRWAERSRSAFVERPGHGIFGIVQGGVHADLRQRLSAPSHEGGRDPGEHAADPAQFDLLRRPDDGVARRDRGRPSRRFPIRRRRAVTREPVLGRTAPLPASPEQAVLDTVPNP